MRLPDGTVLEIKVWTLRDPLPEANKLKDLVEFWGPGEWFRVVIDGVVGGQRWQGIGKSVEFVARALVDGLGKKLALMGHSSHTCKDRTNKHATLLSETSHPVPQESLREAATTTLWICPQQSLIVTQTIAPIVER